MHFARADWRRQKHLYEEIGSAWTYRAKILTSLKSSGCRGVVVSRSEQFLCVVKEGKITVLLPESHAGNVVRLTEMPMQAAIAPEVQEISVKKHEGKAIMVEGRSSGGWIYSAELIDTGGADFERIGAKSVQQIDRNNIYLGCSGLLIQSSFFLGWPAL